MWQRAREKVTELMQVYPNYITPQQDQAIRGRFDIRIAAQEMNAQSGRW